MYVHVPYDYNFEIIVLRNGSATLKVNDCFRLHPHPLARTVHKTEEWCNESITMCCVSVYCCVRERERKREERERERERERKGKKEYMISSWL